MVLYPGAGEEGWERGGDVGVLVDCITSKGS